MIFYFVPDIIRNKIEELKLNSNKTTTKTQESFYEFLVNSRPNFDIQNKIFKFYMPIEITQIQYECTEWNIPCEHANIIDDSLSKLFGEKYCKTKKFCPKQLYSIFEPSEYTVKVEEFMQIDNINTENIASVTDAHKVISNNLLNIIKDRTTYLTNEIVGFGDIQQIIKIVFDKDILFLNDLKEVIKYDISHELNNIIIEMTDETEISPLYEVAKLFDDFYTDLIKEQFTPFIGMKILIHTDLTVLPIIFTTNIIKKLNEYQTLTAIKNITFARDFISWEPLTMQIDRESGIMAVLIKKLKEQNYTFEQFLEMQLDRVKFPKEP